jgi:hypothetical protein
MLDRQFFRPLDGVAVCIVSAFNRCGVVVILKKNPPATGRGWTNTYAVNSFTVTYWNFFCQCHDMRDMRSFFVRGI